MTVGIPSTLIEVWELNHDWSFALRRELTIFRLVLRCRMSCTSPGGVERIYSIDFTNPCDTHHLHINFRLAVAKKRVGLEIWIPSGAHLCPMPAGEALSCWGSCLKKQSFFQQPHWLQTLVAKQQQLSDLLRIRIHQETWLGSIHWKLPTWRNTDTQTWAVQEIYCKRYVCGCWLLCTGSWTRDS